MSEIRPRSTHQASGPERAPFTEGSGHSSSSVHSEEQKEQTTPIDLKSGSFLLTAKNLFSRALDWIDTLFEGPKLSLEEVEQFQVGIFKTYPSYGKSIDGNSVINKIAQRVANGKPLTQRHMDSVLIEALSTERDTIRDQITGKIQKALGDNFPQDLTLQKDICEHLEKKFDKLYDIYLFASKDLLTGKEIEAIADEVVQSFKNAYIEQKEEMIPSSPLAPLSLSVPLAPVFGSEIEITETEFQLIASRPLPTAYQEADNALSNSLTFRTDTEPFGTLEIENSIRDIQGHIEELKTRLIHVQAQVGFDNNQISLNERPKKGASHELLLRYGNRLVQDISYEIAALENKNKVLKARAKEFKKFENPLSQQKFNQSCRLYLQSYQNFIADALTSNPKEDSKAKEIFNELNTAIDKLLQDSSTDTLKPNQVAKAIKKLQSDWQAKIKEALKEDDIEVDNLKSQLREAFIGVLRTQEWETLSFDLQLTLGKRSKSFNSCITPAGQLPQFKTQYANEGIRGVPSVDTASKHALNLAITEFSVAEKDKETGKDTPKTFFQAIRQGIMSATGIKDDNERRTANLSRARECVEVAAGIKLQSEINGGELELAGLERNEKGELTYELKDLKLSSLSLVTPDKARWGWDVIKSFLYTIGILKEKPSISNERAMLQEHVQAWEGLMEENKKGPTTFECTVNVNGRPEKVIVTILQDKLTILSSNVGTNQGATQSFAGLSSHWSLVGGWDVSDALNEEVLQAFMGSLDPKDIIGGEAARTLEGLDINHPKRKKITLLIAQIRDIYAKQSYKQDKDPYKLATRLAMLSNELGYVVAFNCKSGKDRTGMLDVEWKFTEAYYHAYGELPDPDIDLTQEQKAALTQIALRSGNLEMQRYSTSLEGSKTKLLTTREKDPIAERLLERMIHEGASKAVAH